MSIERRRVLGAIAATTAAGLAAPAVSQTRVNLTASTRWAAAETGTGALARRFARRLSDLSDGQIQIEISATPVSGIDAYVGVSRGDVALHFGHEEDWLDLNPAYSLFCSSPFGMTDNEFEGWIIYGEGGTAWTRLAEESGVRPMLAGDLGLIPTMIKTDVNELTDLSGMTATATGMAARFWNTMGVKAGAGDKTILDDPFTGGYAAAEEGWRVLSPSVSRPHHALSANFNIPAFEALSEEHKGLVNLAMRSEHMAQRLDAEDVRRGYAADDPVKLSSLVATQMALATKELMGKIEFGGRAAGDALWSHQLHLEDARAWTEISEGAYLAKRRGTAG